MTDRQTPPRRRSKRPDSSGHSTPTAKIVTPSKESPLTPVDPDVCTPVKDRSVEPNRARYYNGVPGAPERKQRPSDLDEPMLTRAQRRARVQSVARLLDFGQACVSSRSGGGSGGHEERMPSTGRPRRRLGSPIQLDSERGAPPLKRCHSSTLCEAGPTASRPAYVEAMSTAPATLPPILFRAQQDGEMRRTVSASAACHPASPSLLDARNERLRPSLACASQESARGTRLSRACSSWHDKTHPMLSSPRLPSSRHQVPPFIGASGDLFGGHCIAPLTRAR